MLYCRENVIFQIAAWQMLMAGQEKMQVELFQKQVTFQAFITIQDLECNKCTGRVSNIQLRLSKAARLWALLTTEGE